MALSGGEGRGQRAGQIILYTRDPGRSLAGSAAKGWSHGGWTQRTAP